MKTTKNIIEIYNTYIDKTYILNYIYQGDTSYLILIDKKPLFYIDLDNFDVNIDKIKTRKQENKIITNIVQNIINDYDYKFYFETLREAMEHETRNN